MNLSKKQVSNTQIESQLTLHKVNLAITEGNLTKTLASNKTTPEEIFRIARRGISGREIQDMVNEKLTTTKELAYVLGVNERTVRTYQREQSELSPQQSEQLLKYNRLLFRGKEIFGSEDAFKRWLHKPAYGLDNDIPLEYLVTSEGINLVSEEVERIANGEFA